MMTNLFLNPTKEFYFYHRPSIIHISIQILPLLAHHWTLLPLFNFVEQRDPFYIRKYSTKLIKTQLQLKPQFFASLIVVSKFSFQAKSSFCGVLAVTTKLSQRSNNPNWKVKSCENYTKPIKLKSFIVLMVIIIFVTACFLIFK